jgi:hypothetical protein
VVLLWCLPGNLNCSFTAAFRFAVSRRPRSERRDDAIPDATPLDSKSVDFLALADGKCLRDWLRYLAYQRVIISGRRFRPLAAGQAIRCGNA